MSDLRTDSLKANRLEYLILGAILLISILLRFINLEADIPQIQRVDDIEDEGYWAIIARDLYLFGAFDRDSNFFQGFIGAPLTVMLQYISSFLLGGMSFISIRVLTAIYSSLILILGLFYFLRIRKNFNAALIFTGLYGLYPATLFYGRMGLLEPHWLFYTFLTFILLEFSIEKLRPNLLYLAGFIFSICLVTKSLSILVFPSILLFLVFKTLGWRNKLISIFKFSLGFIPLSLIFGFFLAKYWREFYPTFKALTGTKDGFGYGLSPSAWGQFWSTYLVLPYYPWFLGLLISIPIFLIKGLSLRFAWPWYWIGATWVVLVIKPLTGQARNFIFFFPLIILSSEYLSHFTSKIFSEIWKKRMEFVLGILLCLGSGLSFYYGRETFFAPTYSLRDASVHLSSLTSEQTKVIGPHSYLLSLYAKYRPMFSIRLRNWSSVDPIQSIQPNILLSARMYKGDPGIGKTAWLDFQEFPFRLKIDSVSYLQNRFVMDIYRIYSHPSQVSAAP